MKIHICKMCFVVEKKVQDCSGWELFECNLQAGKVALTASVQGTARLLAMEEEPNRCQTLITSVSSGKKSLVCLKSRLFLSKLSFSVGISPSFSHCSDFLDEESAFSSRCRPCQFRRFFGYPPKASNIHRPKDRYNQINHPSKDGCKWFLSLKPGASVNTVV